MVGTIIVRPTFDIPTKYSFKWGGRLIEDLGIEDYIDLAGDLATRKNTEKALKENPNADFIFYNHGDEQGLLAQDGKGYVIDKRNNSLLQGRVAYSMACLWGKDGGADTYRKGAKAVWSYTKIFSFVTTDEAIFCRLANMGLILRRREHLSWEDCVSRVKEAYNVEIEKGGNPWTVISLINDRDALVCWTDANQPSSDCDFRNMGIRLFGTAGQKLSKSLVIATIAYYTSWGYGVYSVCQLKGSNVVLEGVYTTLALMFLLPIVLLREHIRWLKN